MGLALLVHRKNGKMVLVDISEAACRTSRKNAERLGVEKRAYVVRSHWLKAFKKNVLDFVVSNPPYIKKDDVKGLQDEIRLFEPLEALSGGEDGLDAYREMALLAKDALKPGGRIYLEIGAGMEDGVKGVFSSFSHVKTVKDLSGIPRVLVFEV